MYMSTGCHMWREGDGCAWVTQNPADTEQILWHDSAVEMETTGGKGSTVLVGGRGS